jgi:type I restriction enzyme S subunit
MANNWQEMELGNVITLQRGFDLPIQDRKPGSIPIISSSGRTGTHSEAMVSGPGVVTGRYGTIGEVFYLEHDFWPLNTTLFVKDFKGNDPRFVFYLLKTVDFSSCSDKSSVPGVNRNHLHRLRVSVPVSVAEQRAIAGILGAFDDKMELDWRTNETLEAMAKAVFKSWFVDFAPVQANAQGRQPFGMDEATAAVFPKSFEDSPLGKIPKGWRVGKIAEVVSLSREAITPSDFSTESFDHYSIPAFDEARWPSEDIGAQVKSNKYLVTNDAVLLSKLNPRIPRGMATLCRC